MSIAWTPQQEEVFAETLYGNTNLFVAAVAGSGKTTTIVEAANRLLAYAKERNQEISILFCAFNRDIVMALQGKMPGIECKTMNSLGLRLVRSALPKTALVARNLQKIQPYKYNDLVKQYLGDGFAGAFTGNGFKDTCDELTELVKMAQAYLSDGSNESLRGVADHFGILDYGPLTEQDAYSLVRTVLAQGERLAREGVLSFDDQIWLPGKWNLQTSFTYNYVFVDEAQDTSPAKLDLLLRYGN